MKTSTFGSKKRPIILLSILLVLVSALSLLFGCSGEKKLKEIQLLMPPAKVEYLEGEEFDSTGMTIVGVYEDGSRVNVTDYTIDKTEPLTVDDTEVTISYGGFEVTQTISVIKPEDQIVILLANGVDRCELYADGTACMTGGGATGGIIRGIDAWWSWDGERLRIWAKNYTDGVKDEKATELSPQKDEQNNYTLRYVAKGRWTMNYFVKYSEWSKVLKEGVPYVPVEGTIEIPYDNVYAPGEAPGDQT